MAQNITLLGATYQNVPAVLLPKSGGGSAMFNDTSDANATEADLAVGTTAYVRGVLLHGTGGGGVEDVASVSELVSKATAANLGKYYRYVGPTTSSYQTDDVYQVEYSNSTYGLLRYRAEWTSDFAAQTVRQGTANSSDVVTFDIVTSGDVACSRPASGSNGAKLAVVEFTPSRNCNYISVTFSFKATYLQAWSNKYFSAAILESLPTTYRLSNTETPLNKPFAFGGNKYTTKSFTLAFTGQFNAGQKYYFVVATCTTSAQNTAALVDAHTLVFNSNNT